MLLQTVERINRAWAVREWKGFKRKRGKEERREEGAPQPCLLLCNVTPSYKHLPVISEVYKNHKILGAIGCLQKKNNNN